MTNIDNKINVGNIENVGNMETVGNKISKTGKNVFTNIKTIFSKIPVYKRKVLGLVDEFQFTSSKDLTSFVNCRFKSTNFYKC